MTFALPLPPARIPRRPECEYDVIVAGSGAAGLFAAISAHAHDPTLHIAIVTRAGIASGGSTIRSHAVDAAQADDDSPELHFEDTLRAGGWHNDVDLVRVLVEQAPARIRDLEALGCAFARTKSGALALNTYGGNQVCRAVRGAGMLLGTQIGQTLAREVSRRGIVVHEGVRLADLWVEDAAVRGVLCYDSRRGGLRLLGARAVVLACGGGTAMYSPSTAGPTKTCDGIAAAFRASARLVDMEMVQFHPTGIMHPGHPLLGDVVPEEMRAQGAVLRDGEGRPLQSQGLTRDRLSALMYGEIQRLAARGLFMDLSGVCDAEFDRIVSPLEPRLAGYFRRHRAGLTVAPSAHYLIGGLAIDVRAATTIPGLYACGEDAGGIHGANRIGGNGLADAIVFGHIAGQQAASYASVNEVRAGSAFPRVVQTSGTRRVSAGRGTLRLRKAMWSMCGIVRVQNDLRKLEASLEKWKREYAEAVAGDVGQLLDYRNLLEGAHLICRASLARDANLGCFSKAGMPDVGSRYRVLLEGPSTFRLPHGRPDEAGSSSESAEISQA